MGESKKINLLTIGKGFCYTYQTEKVGCHDALLMFIGFLVVFKYSSAFKNTVWVHVNFISVWIVNIILCRGIKEKHNI